MNLSQPPKPPFDLEMWAQQPFARRARLSVEAFGVNGIGQPPLTYVYYGIKLLAYVAGWMVACAFTQGPGHFGSDGWWGDPVAFYKAIAWTMLFEVLGFGCGSGPLTGHISPMVTAYRHWLRPGTTKLPLFEGAPLIGGIRRTWFDVALYLALLVSLIRALIAPALGFEHWLPIVALLPILGVLDKPIFLAARSEHHWTLMVIFAFSTQWIAGAKFLWLALWFFAGVSKLNAYFPTVIAVMTSNNPFFKAVPWMAKSMYRDYPNDMIPSKHASAHAVAGTVMELGLPTVMTAAMWTQDPTLLLVGTAMVFALHGFILSNVPVGVPLEWNVIMAYGGFFLFYLHPEVTPLSLGLTPVTAFLLVTCVALPIYGNFWPARISFLLAMRYYAGNWPVSVYLFRGDSHKKLERLVKAAPWVDEQAANSPADVTPLQTQFALAGSMAFRLLHLHGRAFHSLLPRVVDDMKQYTWIDGEVVCGMALGWNFGDGHLHHEQLVRTLQAQCEFEVGDLRCIFLEAQPLFGNSQAYRLYDAKTGQIEAGSFPVETMKQLQPWPSA